MSRARFFVVRSIQTVFLLWVAFTGLFFFFRFMPGDFTNLMLAEGANPDAVAEFEERWGLNDPLYVQYWRYFMNILSGDAGMSIQFRRPVWDMVNTRIFNSFILIAPGITFAYLLGSIYGSIVGTKRGSKLEEYGILPLIFVGSVPAFVTSIILVIIFSSWLNLFPTSGMISPGRQAEFAQLEWYQRYLSLEFIWHFILPFTAVMFRYLYLPTMIMRTSIVEVMGQGFAFFHRITGISKRRQLAHLARHASLPVITVYPISMTRALGGLVLIEVVFNWPGIGNTLVNAVMVRDLPIIQFVFFLVAAYIILANFVVDIVYGIIDPRVSVGAEDT